MYNLNKNLNCDLYQTLIKTVYLHNIKKLAPAYIVFVVPWLSAFTD